MESKNLLHTMCARATVVLSALFSLFLSPSPLPPNVNLHALAYSLEHERYCLVKRD